MTNEQTHNLAERIAALLQETEQKSGETSLYSSLERINSRLDKIEAQISSVNPKSQIPSPKSIHASQEKFKSLEELADQIIDSVQNEKACPYEPTGKPCDHCSMCNSRGF